MKNQKALIRFDQLTFENGPDKMTKSCYAITDVVLKYKTNFENKLQPSDDHEIF